MRKMPKMKPLIVIVFALCIAHSTVYSQKVEFSNLLTSTGGVHSPVDFAVDHEGYIYVAGGAREGLPATDNAFQKHYHGHDTWSGGDAYLMKLSPDGDLLYATYIGGKGGEESVRIALDTAGNIYVCGSTWSSDFPVTDNAVQKKKGIGADNFIIKFNPALQPVASTYLGGNGFDYCSTINVRDNRVYVTGRTNSTDFPVTNDAIAARYETWHSPDPNWQRMIVDVSIAVLTADLDSVLYASYLGGKDRDEITSVAFDAEKNMVLTGMTWSENFPTTPGCYDSTLSGGRDGFITVLTPDLRKIIYSTYLGGNAIDDITNCAEIDEDDNLLLSGNTNSSDFPKTPDAFYGDFIGGDADGFIMKFNLRTHTPVYSTYIGGKGNDEIKHFTKVGNAKYLLVGHSQSNDFPIAPAAPAESYHGGIDLVVSMLDDHLTHIEYSTFIGGAQEDRRLRAKVMDGHILYVSLHTTSPEFPITKKFSDCQNKEAAVLMKIDLGRR